MRAVVLFVIPIGVNLFVFFSCFLTTEKLSRQLPKFFLAIVVVFAISGLFSERTLGGKIYYGNPRLNGTDFDASDFYEFSFNDFLSSQVSYLVILPCASVYVFMRVCAREIILCLLQVSLFIFMVSGEWGLVYGKPNEI